MVDLTLPGPEQNLALDETLLRNLDAAVASGGAVRETLRFWESKRPCVVIGNGGKIHDEVDVRVCEAAGVPIARRASGGGAVLVGDGCLNYALVLSLESRPELRNVMDSFRAILEPVARALGIAGIELRGGADLALDGRKFGGSAQRRTRHALLHHGTILCGMDLTLVARVLRQPPRSPAWRAGRSHADFLCNLPLTTCEVKTRISVRAQFRWIQEVLQ